MQTGRRTNQAVGRRGYMCYFDITLLPRQNSNLADTVAIAGHPVHSVRRQGHTAHFGLVNSWIDRGVGRECALTCKF